MDPIKVDFIEHYFYLALEVPGKISCCLSALILLHFHKDPEDLSDLRSQ